MTGVFEVQSVEATWALARRLAAELKPGDVVCLEGDLGAGKTTFAQGLAAALGVTGRVTSPTFCIVQEHRPPPVPGAPAARPPALVHMDLYRLHGEDEVVAIGWEDYLAEGAILAVEWPERAGSLIPPQAQHVVFTHLEGPESRRIRFWQGTKTEEERK
ncbi:MAG: tRNA (adenosine(37)-N6)-threonylcarbamoyltransferase complex ATPase subunit type 1 TsaE [Kiritimatiellia bacterium]